MGNSYTNPIEYSGTRTETIGGREVNQQIKVVAVDACTVINVPEIESQANEIRTLCDNSFSELKQKYSDLVSDCGDSIVINGQNVGTLIDNVINAFWNESGGVPQKIDDDIATIINSAYIEHNNKQVILNNDAYNDYKNKGGSLPPTEKEINH